MISLRRGPRLSSTLSKSEEVSESRPRVKTPIYRKDPSSSVPKRPVGKSRSDRLLDLLADEQYHGVGEIASVFSRGEWTMAIKECLVRGYAFDRAGDRFRVRRRLVTERAQGLFELLDRIELDKLRLDKSRVVSSTKSAGQAKESSKVVAEEPGPFHSGKDQALSAQGEARLVLSSGDDELTLSAVESATMTGAILAKRSSGKTYLGMVLAEEILKITGFGVPIVVVDPTGVWAPGLRSTAGGTPSPFRLLTLGGAYGDFPLSSGQGVVAAEVVEGVRPHSVILDVSQMVPSGQHELVADFGERLFSTSKREPLLMIVDEADEFAPQSLSSSSAHQKRSLEIMDRIVRRGRIKGLGTILITQRAAVVSKNVLSQIDSLFLLCMLAPSDLDAVEDWLRRVVPLGQRTECLRQLPSLGPGEAFFLQGGASPKFRKFQVRKRDTFDSSRTPKALEKVWVPELSEAPAEVLKVAREILSRSSDPGFLGGGVT